MVGVDSGGLKSERQEEMEFAHPRLRYAGRETAASPATDEPATLAGGEVANMVDAGKAVAGQGAMADAMKQAMAHEIPCARFSYLGH